MIRDDNDAQVRMGTWEPVKKKEMFRDKKLKRVRTYAEVLSTGNLSNKREVSILNKVNGCNFKKIQIYKLTAYTIPDIIESLHMA